MNGFIIIVIVGLLGFCASFLLFRKSLKSLQTDTKINKLSDINFKDYLKYILLFFASGVVTQLGINLSNNWDMKALEIILSLLGGGLFSAAVATVLGIFFINFYKEGFKKEKLNYLIMGCLVAAAIVFFILLTEGVAKHLTYPLISGISFGGDPFISFFTAERGSRGGLSIAFYGAIMIFSVVVVYWVCDHEFFKKYGKHGILDAVVLVVFPAGVIGARLGYVIGNWNGDLSGPLDGWNYWIVQGNWIKIWNGGLTILGGAIGGILVGVIFVKLRRKYVDVRWAMDVIVPAILIAQAMGRWGNFFNHEVYGSETSMDSWGFLPTFVRYQMATGWKNGLPNGTTMYVPLFLIESLINILGYFVIRFGIGRLVPKILPSGSLAGAYLSWYGVTRIIMEPLRDPTFNMGSNGMWSVIWSGIYIGGGIALIGLFFLLDYLKKKKSVETK